MHTFGFFLSRTTEIWNGNGFKKQGSVSVSY